jgi:hypothetical protein
MYLLRLLAFVCRKQEQREDLFQQYFSFTNAFIFVEFNVEIFKAIQVPTFISTFFY